MVTKRELAGDIVGHFGRYMEDAPVCKYVIRLGANSFHESGTHLLADAVAQLPKKELLKYHRMIPVEELVDEE